MNQRLSLAPSLKAAVTGAALLLVPSVQASEGNSSGQDRMAPRLGDFAFKVEPGVVFPITDPQSRIFKVGGGQTIKALWLVNKYLCWP